MNYIQRAKIAQKILTAAGDVEVVTVTLWGYASKVAIQTVGPIQGYEYKPRHEGGHPVFEFTEGDVAVQLVYVPDEEVAA